MPRDDWAGISVLVWGFRADGVFLAGFAAWVGSTDGWQGTQTLFGGAALCFVVSESYAAVLRWRHAQLRNADREYLQAMHKPVDS